MRYKLLIVILLLTTLSWAQQGGYDFAKAEKEARRLVVKYPDSALVIIKKGLAQKNAHDTVYANLYNVYGLYYGIVDKQDSSIFYQKKSVAMLDNYPKLKARSLVSLSVGYRKKAQYATAIKYANAAVAINKSIKNNQGLGLALGELASNYTLQLEYDKSISYLLKAIAILKKEGNTDKITVMKQRLANTYLAKNNFQFAIDMYRECLKEFKENGMMKNYYLTEVNLGEALIHTKDYRGAKEVLTEAANGLAAFGDKTILGICYSKIGNLEDWLKNGNGAMAAYQKAMDNLLPSGSDRVVRIAAEYILLLNKYKKYPKALSIIATVEQLKLFNSINTEDQIIYKQAVADTWAATGNDKLAIKAYQRSIALKDSIFDTQRDIAIQEVQAKFQTQLQREKNISLEANNKALKKTVEANRTLWILYIIGCMAIITVILLALRSYWLKARLQHNELKAVEAEKNMIKQQHLHEMELNNAQKETIDEKQRELTSTALRMANYQDGINAIIEKCMPSTKSADIKRELLQLVKDQDYWKQFETRFNHLHPEFGNTLTNRFSKLTKNDIEFCSLLKLNLSNKEIASLLQISHESAITKKYRIKKKMEINDDAEFEKMLMEM